MSDAPSTLTDTRSRPEAPAASMAQLAAVAVAYVLIAIAILALSTRPNQSLHLFPSAGLALAATLVYGQRALWAVLLGSLGFQLFLVNTTGYHGRPLLVAALAIPLGAVAQAAFGAWLVKRQASGPLTLDSPKSIGRLFLLGGAVACVVSATWSTGLLWLTGAIEPSKLLSVWAIWWSGDAVGVIVGVPAVLTLIGRPRRTWHPRRFTVGLPLVLACLMLALAMLQVSRNDEQRAEARFERDANDLVTAISLRPQAHLFALDALHSVYVASDEVSTGEFEKASTDWLQKLPGMQALGWHEVVPRERIGEFERRAREQGDVSFRVFERNSALSANDTEAIVMRHAIPRASNETAIGINVLSIAEPREAIARARQVDQAVASAAFRLTQETGQQRGVVLYRAVKVEAAGSARATGAEPVPGPAEANPAPRRLKGLVFLTLRMEDALAGLLAGGPTYLQTCLLDTLPSGQFDRLAGPPGCDTATAAANDLVHRVELPFAGRRWVVDVRAPTGTPAPSAGLMGTESSAAWLFYLTGLGATAMMGALLLLVTGRERLTQAAVERRTLQLQHEIAERQLTERALRESEGRFRSIFKTVPIGMLYTDLAGRIKQANSALCTLTGYSEEELLSLSVATLTHREDRELDDARRRDLIAAQHGDGAARRPGFTAPAGGAGRRHQRTPAP